MTGIADRSGIDVAGTLAAGRRAIVATDASANHRPMIDSTDCHRCPRHGCRLMTGLTGIECADMSDILAAGNTTIVTTFAATGYL